MVTIRRATCEDIPNIMKFMDEHWKPGNILAKNREFFDWQFVEDDNSVNMWIGIDEEDGKIYGMVGAIVYSRCANPDISVCTWQVIKSVNPMLGMDLQQYMYKQLQPRYSYAIGLSKKAMKINTLCGYKPTEMEHYYRLNDCQNYNIAIVKNKVIPIVKDVGYSLQCITSVEQMKQIVTEEQLGKTVMSKDYHYIEKRYFKHPIYHYDVWKIVDDFGESTAVLVTRTENVENSRMCKIIDCYGDIRQLSRITSALDRLMKQKNYEYIDVYSCGVPKEIYEQAGFLACDQSCENVIPNYFHPFTQENITLRTFETDYPNFRMFRGDGDQDRPC